MSHVTLRRQLAAVSIRHGQLDVVRCSGRLRAAVRAHGAIEAGTTGRGSRTSGLKCRARLRDRQRVLGQEGDGMNFVAGKRPGDAVVKLNPDLVGKKGQHLSSFRGTLRSDRELPCVGMLRRHGPPARHVQIFYLTMSAQVRRFGKYAVFCVLTIYER
jgi:hypothetical protein